MCIDLVDAYFSVTAQNLNNNTERYGMKKNMEYPMYVHRKFNNKIKVLTPWLTWRHANQFSHFKCHEMETTACGMAMLGGKIDLRVSCGINKTNYQMVIGTTKTLNAKWKVNTPIFDIQQFICFLIHEITYFRWYTLINIAKLC